MNEIATWRVRVTVPADAAAPVARALEPFCAAVSWREAEGGDCVVNGYSLHEPDGEAIAAALAAAEGTGLEPLSARVAPVAPRDWLAHSLRQFPPLTVGRFFIHSDRFADRVPPGCVGLNIGAGTAFGSGAHASTAGCLLALQGLAGRRRFGAPLDIGSGSGILAIAMAKIWRRPVIACDVDAEAVAVTQRNARRNGVGPLVRAVRGSGYGAPAVRRGAPFDLVCANILARPLCRMAIGLGRRLSADGVAVLSGFVERDGPGVLAAHRRSRLALRRRIVIDGWQTLVVGR